jgi:hypothetical protein
LALNVASADAQNFVRTSLAGAQGLHGVHVGFKQLPPLFTGIWTRIKHGTWSLMPVPTASGSGKHWFVNAFFRRLMIVATAGRYPYSGSSPVALSATSMGQSDDTMPLFPIRRAT